MQTTKVRRKPLSWKAQLSNKGTTYCAPACGGGCTWRAWNLATKRAAVLAARLGPGWKPRVWENLGWHYSVISPCGRWKVHAHHDGAINASPDKPVRYSAFLGDADSTGGKWAMGGSTPEAAMRTTWKAAKEAISYFASFADAGKSIPKSDRSATRRRKP